VLRCRAMSAWSTAVAIAAGVLRARVEENGHRRSRLPWDQEIREERRDGFPGLVREDTATHLSIAFRSASAHAIAISRGLRVGSSRGLGSASLRLSAPDSHEESIAPDCGILGS
jgi:hypothetical protein